MARRSQPGHPRRRHLGRPARRSDPVPRPGVGPAARSRLRVCRARARTARRARVSWVTPGYCSASGVLPCVATCCRLLPCLLDLGVVRRRCRWRERRIGRPRHDVLGTPQPRPPRCRPAFPTAFRRPPPAPSRRCRSRRAGRSPRRFPRTSGTGRLGGGAAFWSDFVYDDHGANGGATVAPARSPSLAPTDGTYTYPAGPAKMNGADIFRAGVGLDSAASYWRIDWNTLADPKVPIAEWTFDTDHNAADRAPPPGRPAPASAAPASTARWSSAASGARVLNGSGTVLATLPTTVDTIAALVRRPGAADACCR